MLFATHSLSRRVIGTLVLLYLTVGLWMYYVDKSAFKGALQVVLPGDVRDQQDKKDNEGSYLQRVLPYTRPSGFSGFSSSSRKNENIFIIFRTSSTSLWRRGPMHLQTLLQEPRQYQIYSDYAENFGGRMTIDALDGFENFNVPPEDLERRKKLFELRRDRPDLYWEDGALPGDDIKSALNWGMDKYKFMPVLQHAYASTKDQSFNWYLMMEDDSFILWDNLVEKLKCYDPKQPIVLGHFGWRLDEIFPHGGSGMVLSRAAMDKLFANGKFDLHRWQEVNAQHHVGDHVLGSLLHEHGIEVNMGNRTQIGFESDSHRNIKVASWTWNTPLLSVHKVHQRDISDLHALQSQLTKEGKAFTYGQMFRNFIWPYIHEERACWNNEASEQTSVSEYNKPRPDESAFSKDACKQSCEAWNECLMWRYDEDGGCHRDSEVALGSGLQDCDAQIFSGWMRSRIEQRMLHLGDEQPDYCVVEQ